MAISLKDVKEKRAAENARLEKDSIRTDTISFSFSEENKRENTNANALELINENNQPEKSVRPWENFEKRGMQTRTISAREAVKKAQMILKRNEEYSQKLKEKGFLEEEEVSGDF